MPAALRSASSLSLADLTCLFNAGYEGYVIPFRLDEAAHLRMIESFDIDQDASRVAFMNGEPVGFANLAIRGDEAWIGGVGVVPTARRRGLAEQMMRAVHDEARAKGVEHVWLEVIDQNEAASLLYEKLAYDVVREVEVWTLPADAPGGSAREVSAAQAHARVRELRTTREPWQRADGTLAHYDDALGLETAGGAVVFREDATVQLVQIAGEDAQELLRTLQARGTVGALNVPVEDPVSQALHELGGSVRVRQREMVLAL